jgi:hypothetical protein
VHFQRSSDDMLVSRAAGTEVWDGGTRQRVLGPLPVAENATRVAGMLAQPGRFVTLDQLAGAWSLQIREVGRPEPLAAIDLGTSGSPGSISADGGLVALDSVDGDLAAVVRTDPAAWRAELCRAVGGADLTAADRAAHPGLPDGPVCPGPVSN